MSTLNLILIFLFLLVIFLFYKIEKLKDKKIYKNVFKYEPKRYKKYKRYIPKKPIKPIIPKKPVEPIIPEKPIKLPKPKDMNFVLPVMHISP